MEEIELQSMSVVPDSLDFHRFIFKGKVDEVQRFIDSNPKEKVVTFDDNSAIAMALKCNTLEVYEVLVANGFKLAPSEDLGTIMRNIEANPKVKSVIKKKMEEIQRYHMKESTKKHLLKLNLMAKLAPTTPEDRREELEEIIALTFEKLAANPDIEKIMKYISTARSESSKLFVVLSFSNFTICRLANLLRLRR
jgi:FMN phosphatase YigB (HAD superfamily)